jgi:hypothetical protein
VSINQENISSLNTSKKKKLSRTLESIIHKDKRTYEINELCQKQASTTTTENLQLKVARVGAWTSNIYYYYYYYYVCECVCMGVYTMPILSLRADGSNM